MFKDFILNEALDTTPYEYTLEKEDMNHATYSFTDEKDHEYKFLLYRKGTAGKFVWTAIVSEKTPSARAYKRIVGKFNNPKRVLSTILEIFKFIHKERKARVHGLIFELPVKVFGGEITPKLERILRMSLRGLFDVPKVSYSDEETEKLKVVGIPLVMRPHKYADVFKVGDHKETKDLGDTEYKELKRGSDKPKPESKDLKDKESKKEDPESKKTSKKEEPESKKASKKEVDDVIKEPVKKAKTDIKKEEPPAEVKEPFKTRLSRHINKYSVSNLKAVDKNGGTDHTFNEVFKYVKDLDGVDGKRDYDSSKSMTINVKLNSELTISLSVTYTQDEMVSLMMFNGNYSTRLEVFKDSKEFKDVLKNFKLKKVVESGTTTYKNVLSYDEFLNASKNYKVIENLKNINVNDKIDDESGFLRKYFGYSSGDVANLVDKDTGLLKYEGKTLAHNTFKLTSHEANDQLIIEIECNPDELINTTSRYKLDPRYVKVENDKIVFTVKDRYNGGSTTADIINEMCSENIIIDKFEDDFGNDYFVNKSPNSNSTTIYVKINDKNSEYLDVSDLYKLSYNGKNIIYNSNKSSIGFEGFVNNIEGLFKNLKLLNEARNVQVGHSQLTDDEIEAVISKMETEKPSISKKDFEKLTKEYIAYNVSKTLDIKSDIDVNKYMYMASNNLLNVDGVENIQLKLKDSIEKLLGGEYSQLDYYNASVLNHIVIDSHSNIYKSYSKNDSWYNYILKDSFDADDHEKIVKELDKYLPEAKPTVDKLIDVYNDIKDYDSKYLGFKFKSPSYVISKNRKRDLPSVNYVDVNSSVELNEIIDLLIKYNPSKNKSGFRVRDDGTRDTIMSTIGELITNYINKNRNKLSAKDVNELMIKVSQLPKVDQPYFMTADPERFRNSFWHTWASRGGTIAHELCYSMCNDIASNDIGKKFWGETKICQSPNSAIELLNPYLKAHFKWMYEKTQEYYKNKLGKKYEGYKIKLYRGVASDEGVDRYTPATIESWSSLKGTAQSFAKTMSDGKHKFVLYAEVPITAIIGSWEHLGESGDFPRESDLKGKKEYMVLGGALKDIEVGSYYATDKDADIQTVKMFESFNSFLLEGSDKEDDIKLKEHKKLDVVFPGDKSFTSPEVDGKIVTGVISNKKNK